MVRFPYRKPFPSVGNIRTFFGAVAMSIAWSWAASSPSTVHPNWTKINLRPTGFEPMVSGMAFLSDGRLVLVNWDTVQNRGLELEFVRAYSAKVHVLSGVLGNAPNVTIDTIAYGLEDPMGLAVVNDTIYLSGGNTIVRLRRTNGTTGAVTGVDTVFILPGTPKAGSTDSLKPIHGSQEYLYGLLHRNGKFYVSPSALDPKGDGNPQINPYRGTYLEVTPGNGTTDKRGSFRILANGLRASSGLGLGPEGRHCVPDNQGEWLPANKLICIEEGKFYGAKKSGGGSAAYYAPWDSLTETPPTVWAVHNDIARSPTAPLYLGFGTFAGQMLVGDVSWGGIQRYFLEKNGHGDLQGAVFVFTGGLEAGVFRMAIGPDSMVYAGMISGRNTTTDKKYFGLQKLRYNGGTPAFEMLAIRSRPTGFEIEFTKPVDTAVAKLSANYTIQSYAMVPEAVYGAGAKQGPATMTPTSILISADRRKVFLTLEGYTGFTPSTPTEQRVVYFKLNNFKSSTNDTPWSTEAWYTLNAFGTGNPFDPPATLAPPVAVSHRFGSTVAGMAVGRVRDGQLSLRVSFAGPFVAELRGLRGNRLALFRGEGGRGAGEYTFALDGLPRGFAVLEVRTANASKSGTDSRIALRKLIEVR
jgi:hypothetical protein